MDRNIAFDFLSKHLKTKNLVKHCLATESVMRGLARKLGEDENKWAVTGLLHDIDLDIVGGDMKRHAEEGARLVSEICSDEELLRAIRSHNGENLGLERKTRLEWLLAAGETLTGLIVAAALVLPSKKLADVTTDNVLNRMKEKGFARGARREIIKECEKAQMELREFIDISLTAMKEIAPALGL